MLAMHALMTPVWLALILGIGQILPVPTFRAKACAVGMFFFSCHIAYDLWWYWEEYNIIKILWQLFFGLVAVAVWHSLIPRDGGDWDMDRLRG